MIQPPPARTGDRMGEIDTPALLIDLDAMERNLERMAQAIETMPARLRAHAKCHKSLAIAHRQLERGAVGMCCQTPGEAEVLVHGGIRNVLVANQVVGPDKLDRIAGLSLEAEWLGVCVDHQENVLDLQRAARSTGGNVRVLVEIDVGMSRCGIAPGKPAVELARAIVDASNLTFSGLQAYCGQAQHIRNWEERKQAARHAVALARDTVGLLREDGIPCDVVSGAGTGTFRVEGASGVYNEVQAGSYVFMDADYMRNAGEHPGPFEVFEQSLFVYATVMSCPVEGAAVLDAGLKSLAVDSGPPVLADVSNAEVRGVSDEHTTVALESGHSLRPGDKVRLVPGHCDPTVNLHDWFVGVRGAEDRVESVWPVDARGWSR